MRIASALLPRRSSLFPARRLGCRLLCSAPQEAGKFGQKKVTETLRQKTATAVVDGIEVQLGNGKSSRFGFFDYMVLGVPAAICGGLYMWQEGKKLADFDATVNAPKRQKRREAAQEPTEEEQADAGGNNKWQIDEK